MKRIDGSRWQALVRPAKKLQPGDVARFGEEGKVCFLGQLDATVEAKGRDGEVTFAFAFHGPVLDQAIDERGDMPLPPYIASRRRPDERDRADYQTMFARQEGSVAAPTAALHFTDELVVARLTARRIGTHFVTLHIGPGTFLPVKAEDTGEHRMHPEWGTVSAETAEALNAVRRAGGRIVAVGSTSLRLIETAAAEDGIVRPFEGETALFLTPGDEAARGRRAGDELPSAALDAVHAGRGFCRAGCDAARLRPCDRGRLPVLFLWRRLFAISRAMTSSFSFRLIASDGDARCGEIETPHGRVRTPAFMPVGTQATVKGMYPGEVRATGADVVLANTYHLMLRPGPERIAALGGLHSFMNWPHPILTDSGGFQVMSLAPLREIADAGVTFRSHLDGTMYQLSPERAIEIQLLLGADIIMQLDECVRLPATRAELERGVRLSRAWAERSKRAFASAPCGRALFGIVQGGDDMALRRDSARALVDIGFDGYAIGGLAVGEPQDVMLRVIEEVAPLLPRERPHYLMGVGTPEDLLEAVARGMDMFDCVLPTRNGRHGLAFTRFGPLNLKNARHADDPRPLDPESACPAARDYSRAYLHHLVKANELLGAMLLTAVNLAYYQDLMAGMRAAIASGEFELFRHRLRAQWSRGATAAEAEPSSEA